jgi:hypothetical protein
VDDYYIPADLWDELPDLDYFRNKVERSLSTDQKAAVKHQRQLELLEDAVAIYRLRTPPRTVPRILHSEFLSEQVRVRIFLKKLLDT